MNQIKLNRLEQRLINSNPQKDIKEQKNTDGNFSDVLKNVKKENDVKFSNHAKMRLNDRNIILNEQDLEKLNKALNQAENKGVEDALILMKDQVFIASVSSKTIITAIENKDMEDKVFTNIDGAVII